MLRKAEMMNYSVIEPVSIEAPDLGSPKLHTDEYCLEVMRSIVKEYVVQNRQNADDNATKQSFKNRYEEWRQMVRDETLRAFTAFELMEKLYWQEYRIRD